MIKIFLLVLVLNQIVIRNIVNVIKSGKNVIIIVDVLIVSIKINVWLKNIKWKELVY